MRHYENLVIVKPTLTQEEIQNSIAAIEEVITSNGGDIVARDTMGMRRLAYAIDKNPRGHYHVVYYTIKPSAIAEIERRFRINEDLLRFMTVKYESKREVKAWNDLVAKAKAAPAKMEEKTSEAAEEAPAQNAEATAAS